MGIALWARVLLAALAASTASATTIVVATVDNPHMLELRRHTPEFERAHPGVSVRWVVLGEAELRRVVRSDLQTRSGQFDVVTLGMYEARAWAQRDWIAPLALWPQEEVEDLLPSVREGFSLGGRLVAAPFYGESSILFYRRDLADRAGLTMPAQPTWDDVEHLASKLHDPANGVFGICLRAAPGWGGNMALLTTMANTYGGQWFDMDWRPRLDSEAWRSATTRYVRLLREYAPPDATRRGYRENLSLFQAGRCALWVDATIAAGYLVDPRTSSVHGHVGFAPAPIGTTPRGSRWLWSWAFAIPTSTKPSSQAAANAFVRWASSSEYIHHAASSQGWTRVPSGTRASVYAHPAFRRAAPWAELERASIEAANPWDPTLPESPYEGIQFVSVPGFSALGDRIGEQIADAVEGRVTVETALSRAQVLASRKASEREHAFPAGSPQSHRQTLPAEQDGL